MRTIYEAKNYVMNKYGRNVNIRVNGIRNKCENISGKIIDIDLINVILELIPMARETT